MEDKELFIFYKNALCGEITSPLCEEYKNEWRRCGNDKEKLMKLAMRQQSIPYFVSHCYNGKGVSKEYLFNNYADYINENTKNAIISNADGVEGYTYSLYVDYNGILKAATDVLALMWCSNTNLTIQTAKCPIIYVACDSTVHITCDGYNSPKVYLFDNSNVVIDDSDETCNVIVYRYGDKCKVERGKYALCKLNVFDKQLRL